MSDQWFCLDETTYESYCSKVQITDVLDDDLNMLRGNSSLNLNNIKEKIIFDLFYQAIIYSKENGFNFNDAKILTNAIEKELKYLIKDNLEDESIHSSAYERFLNYKSETIDKPISSVTTTKLIITFYTDIFLKNLTAYKYILQELPIETEEFILLQIQTPMIPVSLS